MMNVIHIIGASQRVQSNAADEWAAWYECHKCGEEFAQSSEYCRNEQTAREESKCHFNRQQRRFCYRCGYKLTDKEIVSDNLYITELNMRIDKLEEKCREQWEQIKTLQDVPNDLTEAEIIAISNGWIKPVFSDDGNKAIL